MTAADFELRALASPEVLHSSCRLVWGGSWTVARLRVHRLEGRPADEAFCRRIARDFAKRLIMGYQLVVLPPRFVPLDLELQIRLRPEQQRRIAEKNLLQVFGTGTLADGTRAFFHPDAFGFGQDVELEQVVELALSVTGVVEVDVVSFRRLDGSTGEEMRRGLIAIAGDEIAQLDQVHGRLRLDMAGGR